MLTLAQQALLFQDAPEVPLWIGSPQALAARIEAVPFKYNALKYVMVFMHPFAQFVIAAQAAIQWRARAFYICAP